ncbi:MAG TPA: tRNA 4-thiouridine(8) synthase ThiI, partial [Candidatus Desulfofervidus auxilii]|nr:tRNA 4-thiouridine(8) synthase ThiI [Candidatus Desulfofervidus auxilii]
MHNLSQKKVLNYKALALFSGGLDSILAVLFIRAQGIQVEGVYFESPFFPRNQAVKSAEQINLPLKIVDITHDILALVRHPRFGYGQGLNPCLDCHLLMCNKACEIMHQEGYDFIISGEVLGQRPLSQTKQAMLKINKECLCSDYIVRPLSGKLLPPTIPEQKGIVQREMLLDIRGRS